MIDFYHHRLHLIGIDSLQFSGREIAAIMNAIKPGFDCGALKPYDVNIWPLDDAIAAYTTVEKGASEKQVLVPSG
ncbi:MAG: hypothetical protein JO113_02395 [Candidatus Eremiobacteraeota bacterium]|nr:hypothetical protein [Candidatus Eremiobacteraeota bacterium]